MAEAETTTPIRRTARPIVGLRVEVISGPDRGRTADARSDTLSIGTADNNDLVLTDSTVSRYHLELRREASQIIADDLRSTNGTLVGTRDKGVRIGRATLDPGVVLSLGSTQIRIDDGAVLELEAHDSDGLSGLLGRSPSMRGLMAQIRRAGASDASVLIQGETGSGKEVVAHLIHESSARAEGPLETVDCASLLPSLITSELFGHEAGAFTGANARHLGAFERAQGGTLFLDEIGELSKETQATLLGVLERRAVRRLGGSSAIPVDVRVVAATHRDLRAEVNTGNFRQDLYYRLAVVTLRVPPLRERPEDIPLLVQSFADQIGMGDRVDSVLSPEVISELKTHPWPGNVRELRNMVEAAFALGELPEVTTPRLSPSAVQFDAEEVARSDYHALRGQIVHEFEAKYLVALMRRAGGNVSAAARMAGLSRTHVTAMLKRHRIDPRRLEK
ncbi:MAG: sigma 54-interacting transcriptional regulator [Myxococcota bacterium]